MEAATGATARLANANISIKRRRVWAIAGLKKEIRSWIHQRRDRLGRAAILLLVSILLRLLLSRLALGLDLFRLRAGYPARRIRADGSRRKCGCDGKPEKDAPLHGAYVTTLPLNGK